MVKRTTVLWTLAQTGPATARELAHELDTSTTGVQQALIRLYEDEGLIDRVQQPSDTRGPDPYQYQLVEHRGPAQERVADD